MKIVTNIQDSFTHISYTWKHYITFMKLQKQLLGYYKYKFHDLDKLVLFIFFPFLGKRRISQLHQKFQSHHPTYTKGRNKKRIIKSDISKINWVEAIIDWESARYTKNDKPLNACETLHKYYPEFIDIVEPYLENLNLLHK